MTTSDRVQIQLLNNTEWVQAVVLQSDGASWEPLLENQLDACETSITVPLHLNRQHRILSIDELHTSTTRILGMASMARLWQA